MTNAERIRRMGDEELLEWLDSIGNACMDYDIERRDDYETCRECWKGWLAEESDDPDGVDCSDELNTNKNKEVPHE